MYTSIMVPLDGSAFANRALSVALTLAGRSDATVVFVHVDELPVLNGGGPMFDTRLDRDQQRDTRSELAALGARLAGSASLRIETEFLEGPVVETLLRCLDGGGHDLVVMMTHGRSSLSRAWLGSVAEGLMRHAVVPLLLMREDAEPTAEAAEPLFRRVLVPLDGSALAEEVLDHVVLLGTPGATVYALLSVVEPQRSLGDQDSAALVNDGVDAARRNAAERYLSAVAERLRENGSIVELHVEMHEHPATCILDAAARQHADLIALSTHGRGAVSRLIHGSVADKVVRGATVPTFVRRPVRVGAIPFGSGDDTGTRVSGARPEGHGVVDGRSPRAAV